MIDFFPQVSFNFCEIIIFLFFKIQNVEKSTFCLKRLKILIRKRFEFYLQYFSNCFEIVKNFFDNFKNVLKCLEIFSNIPLIIFFNIKIH